MRAAAGQVAREAHRALRLLFGLALLLLLLAGAAAWRLSQGPIELEVLARAIEDQVNQPPDQGGLHPAPPGAPARRLEVGTAAIGWQGWQEGRLTPVALRLSGVRLKAPDGTVAMDLPDAAVTLSLPWLLKGELAPRVLELREPRLTLRRAADGGVTLLLGVPQPADAAPEGSRTERPGPEGPEPVGGWTEQVLAALMAPPSDASPMAALRLLRVAAGRITVEDEALGLTWSLDQAHVTLRRRSGGGVDGTLAAMLLLGAERVPVSLTLAMTASEAGPPGVAFRLLLPEVRPALLAAAAPGLGPLARLDATLRLAASGRIDAAGTLAGLAAEATAGPGTLDLGAGPPVAMGGLELEAEMAPGRLRVTRGRLLLAAPPGGTEAPTLSLAAEATLREGRWQGTAQLGLDRLAIADLGHYWPPGLAAAPRSWLVENLTAGRVRDGQWQLAGAVGEDLAAPRLTGLSGTLAVEDATVHWLRPIPPAEGASGQVAFGLDQITMTVTAGRQSGSAVVVRGGTVRFLLPDGGQETTEMVFNLAGPVPDVLAVVKHPRLRLFERRPMPIQDARGSLEGRLNIAFPLLADLPVEQLQIRAQARLRDLRLGDILLGRPLERGQAELTVDTNGLRVTGTASLAGIAARLAVEMDFRNGPPSQVVMRETVQATPTSQQLDALGLALPELVAGPVGIEVRSERRRNGQGQAVVKADLRQAQLMVEPLAWAKPPGQIAGGEAVLRLQGESMTAIERFRVEAPGLRVTGSASFGRGTRLERLVIAEAAIDDSRFAGEARPPSGPGGAWSVSLRGAQLDLARAFSEAAPGPTGAAVEAEGEGPAISADARFERVLLGPGRALGAVQARVRVDQHGVVRAGSLSGRAGPRGDFQVEIAPVAGGRSLRVRAADAGALLGSFDVLSKLRGGQLSVEARYAGNRPGATLSGTAEITDFVVQDAPSFAKLLQAMTLYGLVEALSGPGLNFARLVAPFSLTPDVLTLGEARAFSASLGLTATGTLDRRRKRMNISGTVVPAYFFNSLLGNLPLIGRLFAPEAGGGLFAATFRLTGPVEDPQLADFNPLAALTPGFLRGLFQIGQER
ncbi:DUF3971 domain-containing protein [Falsiroseomonas selenitidurans]|uniref:DUF3971 domain-containing protein n=1 Tax=Falsiroseomonas selenitidurans TaxID=2716335 RepID=A0ABX1E3L4_9PROT|nr:DUF3971 domain-containing protein [Falsiroseomonas selenitidurans]NKC31764.1 DUF3971 domain-containing protein [Falsiroseomonas selenitidurans]